jgi:cytochrome P450
VALPPGPREPALLQTLSWVRRPLPWLEAQARRFGDLFTIRLINNVEMVVTTHPDSIRQVFTGSGEVLHAGAAGAVVLSPLVGSHSVLVLDGPAHMRQRKLMLPPFHGARMKAYAEAMRRATERAIADWPTGAPFAVHPFMQRITLEVIVETVFGVDDAEQTRALGDQLARILELGSRPSFVGAITGGLWSSRLRTFLRERDRADEMIYELVDRRRRARDADRTDVLSLLLAARDEDGQPMTDEELRDELVTLLAAGHETTATSLAWTIERLLSHERTLDRATAEVDRELAGDPIDDAVAGRLDYLDAVIKESLRLRPILPMVVRKLAVPLTFRGFDLPAGCIIAPNIYLTHRRPDVYPEPDRFRPERFVGSKPDPYAWLPFGGGIRRCIGMAFALYEMKIVLATILQRRSLTLAGDASDRVTRRAITLAPSDGVRVVARPRADGAAAHSSVA